MATMRRLAVLAATVPLLFAFVRGANAAPTRTLMVLGDSYSSGEGLAPYVTGSDDGDNTCHRSDQAYGHLVADRLGYSIVNRACSGAVIDDMYRDSSRNDGEIAQTKGVQVLGADDAVALTIGGNDAHWTDLVADCTRFRFVGVMRARNPEACQQRKDAGPAEVERIAGRLGELYRAILDSSQAQLYVLLYPPMVPARSPDATKDCSLENLAELGSVGISADTSHRMVELERTLNDRIRGVVADLARTDPRIRVVDVEEEFGGYEGHTISCGFSNRPTPWINALRFDVSRLGRPGEVARRILDAPYRPSSLHPTSAGQQAIARALARAMRSG